MVQINWTQQAQNDLEEIKNYIALDSLKYAEATVLKLFHSVDILQSNSTIGRIVPELENEKFRELIKGNYRIIYWTVDENRIDILTVHHAKRLLENSPLFFQ
jgi:toxin ParE1/3/4